MKKGITVINKTNYKSEILIKIFLECIKICKTNKVRKIKIIYHRNYKNKPVDWCGGYAYVGGSKIIIKLPENIQWIMDSNIGRLLTKAQILATVFIHEIGHLIKVKHNCGCTIEHLFADKIREIFNDEKYSIL